MNSRGALGERLAAQYLKERGYSVVSRNYRSAYGEIDLICTKEDMLVFAEVKTRAVNAMVAGEYAVGNQKQQRIIKTAVSFLSEADNKRYDGLLPRFDVVIIEIDAGRYRTTHYKAAFDLGGMQSELSI